jgi:hypothetical protein
MVSVHVNVYALAARTPLHKYTHGTQLCRFHKCAAKMSFNKSIISKYLCTQSFDTYHMLYAKRKDLFYTCTCICNYNWVEINIILYVIIRVRGYLKGRHAYYLSVSYFKASIVLGKTILIKIYI